MSRAKPMGFGQRRRNYFRQLGINPALAGYYNSRLTPAQHRRVWHKLHHAIAKGSQSGATP